MDQIAADVLSEDFEVRTPSHQYRTTLVKELLTPETPFISGAFKPRQNHVAVH
jgi:hypothetical protein